MSASPKDQIRALLKGIETGDTAAVAVVDEQRYVQHNPLTAEGNIGLAELFKRLAQTSPKVEVVRVFQDGAFVFAHTDYDFDEREIGFEVFRFEEGKAVEHWDNLQTRAEAPNASGHTMIDGPTEVEDLDRTEENRILVRAFVEEVLIGRRFDRLAAFVNAENYTEHNPDLDDGLPSLHRTLAEGRPSREFQTLHRLLVEGNFALSVIEGLRGGVPTSYYDLFRLTGGKIVEHWDTAEPVPDRELWQNENGKF